MSALNRFPTWKNVLVVVVLVGGLIYALPNIFGDDPALQISLETTQPLDDIAVDRVEGVLQQAAITHEAAYLEEGRVMVRFSQVEDQLRAVDLLRDDLGGAYVVALTLAPRTPEFLRNLGLQPMSLGLDLRGGVYFLYEVDMEAAISQALERYESDFRGLLRDERIRYSSVRKDGRSVMVALRSATDRDAAEAVIREADQLLSISSAERGDEYELRVRLSEEQIRQRQDFAIQQNTVTLRNRVNELGVAEPVVQRQGVDRIVVQLPGVQDPAQAERVLGATATLEFRLVDENHDPVVGMRAFDDDGITCHHVITTSGQDQIVSLTPQDGIYGDTLWRIRIGLVEAANIPLSSRCAKYDEYFVSFPDGAPIDLSDLLNLDTGHVPGQPPNPGSQVLPFYLTDGSSVFLGLVDFELPFYLADGSSAPLPLVAGS